MTSSSNSFHPSRYSSTIAERFGLINKANFSFSKKSSSVQAIEPPVPPRVKDGLITAGTPIISKACFIFLRNQRKKTLELQVLFSP